MRQLAKWFRTAFIGLRASKSFPIVTVLALAFFAACTVKRARDEQAEFQKIAQELDQGDYGVAAVDARRMWLLSPDTEWGWRFRLQYALCLLYTRRVGEAAETLKPDLPAAFSSLVPRYRYLKAYLSWAKRDPAAANLVRGAIEAAHVQKDPGTEADALLLLLRCTEAADVQGIAGRALAIAKGNHLAFQEMASYSEIGLDLLSKGQYSDAIPYFLETASGAKRIHAHYFEISTLINLGESYFSIGDLDRARLNLDAALRALRPSDPIVAWIAVNNELGSISSLRRQNSDAVRYFRQAFTFASKDTKLSDYIPTAENLSQALIEAHADDEAARYHQLAADAIRNNRETTAALLAQNELNWGAIEAERGRLPEAEASYLRVLEVMKAQPPNSTKWSAYAQLAEVEERLGNMPKARRNFELALSTIEDNRSRQKLADYQITFLSALIRFYQQYVDFLARQNQMETALAVADSSRASVLTEGQASSRRIPDFAARMHEQARASNSTLLFYWLAPQASYVWAIGPNGERFQKLPPQAEIERDVKSYSAFIQSERQDTLAAANPVGGRLYQTLIGGLAEQIPKGGKVVVVPDGALHGLNFETLLVSGAKPHYWLEDVSVTVAPSLAILMGKGNAQTAARSALILGDPIYTGSGYPPLPESGREVSSVSARFPNNSLVLTQSRAVRSAYNSSNPQLFSIIHFSAHVDADAQSPLDSAIILSAGEGGNRLYARDFMATPLHADLVTISGCRSVGAKALSGEGMVGFAWAAFQAGARNAVTSLWAVDDRSTADLMDHFYGGITAGEPYAQALREAKLQMLQTAYKRPYYWAPFQLYSRNIGSK